MRATSHLGNIQKPVLLNQHAPHKIDTAKASITPLDAQKGLLVVSHDSPSLTQSPLVCLATHPLYQELFLHSQFLKLLIWLGPLH